MFFSASLYGYVHVCMCASVDICVREKDWKYVLNECALFNAKWIQYWNNMGFFSLSYQKTIGVKATKVKTMLWNTFPHNNEPRADTEQWKHNQPQLQFFSDTKYSHLFIFSVTKLFCFAEILIRYNSYNTSWANTYKCKNIVKCWTEVTYDINCILNAVKTVVGGWNVSCQIHLKYSLVE